MASAAQSALEEFLVPVSSQRNGSICSHETMSSGVMPVKQEFQSQVVLENRPPESPDMKFARSRLGHLLNGIRTGEIQAAHQPSKRKDSLGDLEDLSRMGVRPKKILRRERRVVFELRGKPFSLRDTGRTEAVFSLCRTWMRGKEDERPKTEPLSSEQPEPTDDSLDLLATKEILALPKPYDDMQVSPAPPALLKGSSGAKEFNSVEDLLQDSLPHWKEVKRNWCDYGKIRDKRFEKSIQLLETVYGIAQQNAL